MKNQTELHKVDNTLSYVMSSNMLGHKIIKVDNLGDNKTFKIKRTTLFYTSDKEQCKVLFDNCIKKQTKEELLLLEIKNEPKTDFTPVLLQHKSKHHNYNYLIKGEDHLDEMCLKIFKALKSIEYIYHLDILEIMSEEYIDNCTVNHIKTTLRQTNEINIKNNKWTVQHNKTVDSIFKAIDDDNPKGCYQLLVAFDNDNVDLVEFDQPRY